jgi:microcystin-dependent protein
MAYTSNKKPNALNAATSVAAGNEIVVSQAGVVNKATMTQVENFIFSAKTSTTTPTGTEVAVVRQTDNSLRQVALSNIIPDGNITNAKVSASAGIVDTKLATINTAGKVTNNAVQAVSTNTANRIVARDASGNFSAGTITATLAGSITGNAATATTANNVVDGAITNAKVANGAAIAGTKIAPNFGSQNITTTGVVRLNGAPGGTFGAIATGVASPQLAFINNADANNAPFIVIAKSRADGLISGVDTIGNIVFQSHNGTAYQSVAGIAVAAEGSASATSLPTRLSFATTPAAAIASTERMRITGAGNVGINTTTPTERLEVNGNVKATSFLGNVTGNVTGNASTATTATTLATGRTIALTGDVTGTTGAFNGSANVSAATTIANNAVTAGKIADNNVTTAKIANSNVTTAKIADANVTTVKIADANVTTAKIAANAVTSSELANSAVATANIANLAVTTAKIADGNVTLAKLVAAVQEALVPAGAVQAFAMNSAPSGWLSANGSNVSRSVYANLFAAIGTTYGAGNGSTTFTLPDLRGYFVRGTGTNSDGTAAGGFGQKLPDTLKSHTHTGTTASAGNHNHTINGNVIVGGGTGVGGSGTGQSASRDTTFAGAHTHSITTNATGDAETRPKNIPMLYCIKF